MDLPPILRPAVWKLQQRYWHGACELELCFPLAQRECFLRRERIPRVRGTQPLSLLRLQPDWNCERTWIRPPSLIRLPLARFTTSAFLRGCFADSRSQAFPFAFVMFLYSLTDIVSKFLCSSIATLLEYENASCIVCVQYNSANFVVYSQNHSLHWHIVSFHY